MDSLIETIAAWPVWVWLIAWIVGTGVHCVALDTPRRFSLKHEMWSIFWPIVTPIAIPYLAIRRLVRWVRARRAERDQVMADLRDAGDALGISRLALGLQFAGATLDDMREATKKLRRMWEDERDERRAEDEQAFYSRQPYAQPRPTEKSAPYVLDTSREIRELRERVEKLEREVMNG